MAKNDIEAELIRLRSEIEDLNVERLADDFEANQIVTLDKKPLLTIDEASILFSIGVKKIYQLANNQENSFVLKVVNKTLIKRERFEKFLIREDEI